MLTSVTIVQTPFLTRGSACRPHRSAEPKAAAPRASTCATSRLAAATENARVMGDDENARTLAQQRQEMLSTAYTSLRECCDAAFAGEGNEGGENVNEPYKSLIIATPGELNRVNQLADPVYPVPDERFRSERP